MKRFLHACMEWAPGLTIAFAIIAAVMFVIGWILNIAKLFGMTWMTGAAIARAIGVFVPPIGGVLGWL